MHICFERMTVANGKDNSLIELLGFMDRQFDRAREHENYFLSQAWLLDKDGRVPNTQVDYIFSHPTEQNRARVMFTSVNAVAVAINKGEWREDVFHPSEGGFICTFGWRWSNYIEKRRTTLGYEIAYENLIELVDWMASKRLEEASKHYSTDCVGDAELVWKRILKWTSQMKHTAGNMVEVKPIGYPTATMLDHS